MTVDDVRRVAWFVCSFALFGIALTSGHLFSVEVRIVVAFVAGQFFANV